MDEDAGDVIEVVRPPYVLLILAAVAAAAGAVLVPVSDLGPHWIGYLVSSVGCFTLTATYFQLDQRRAARPVDYRPWSGSRGACTAVVVVGFVVACWHVWVIATELAVV